MEPNLHFMEPNSHFMEPNSHFMKPNLHFTKPNLDFTESNLDFTKPNLRFMEPNMDFDVITVLLFDDFECLNGTVRCYFQEVNSLCEGRKVLFFNIGSLPHNFAYHVG